MHIWLASLATSCARYIRGGWIERIIELNRLCANEGLPKNVLSFFVSKCLDALPKPMCVVSFADSGQNHHGYIYQATNFLYTGMSQEHTDYVMMGNEKKHPRGSGVRKDTDGCVAVHRSRKHRYIYFTGSKSDKKAMRKALKYPIEPHYPKGDNVNYDASYEPNYQGLLF